MADSYHPIPTGTQSMSAWSHRSEKAEKVFTQKDLWQANMLMRQRGLIAIFMNPISLLLISFPFGIISSLYNWGPMYTFWLNFLALVPLAKILGDATEELDANINNQMLSGLINATFGNAVEMIVTINALKANMIEVVKMSLLGSIISNMLLVLGMSFFFGGILRKNKGEGKAHLVLKDVVLDFNLAGCLENVTMVFLASLSLTLTTVFSSTGNADDVLSVSRVGSCILITSYGCYLFFQLYTHAETLGDSDDPVGPREASGIDHQHLTKMQSITLLCVAAICCGISSEFLVGAIEGVVDGGVLKEAFIGVILLPIIGNACEHMAAVRFAIQNQPNLTIGIAVGSSTQIGLFVVPFSVLAAWAMDVEMTLDFGPLHAAVMVLSVLTVMSIVLDGKTNWLEGWLLMSAYAFIAVLYWH